MEKTDAITTFLKISTYLTGFSEVELQGTGLLETYYNVALNQSTPADAAGFLATAAQIMREHRADLAGLNAAIAARLLPDSLYAGLAKNIIGMWYLGSWAGTIISPQTYVQGLVWGVAGAHPPGARQPGYGSWSRLPVSIKPTSADANA